MAGVTPAPDADADVDIVEPGLAQEQQWLQNLVPEDGRLDGFNGRTIDPHHAVAALAVRDRHGVALAAKHLGGG